MQGIGRVGDYAGPVLIGLPLGQLDAGDWFSGAIQEYARNRMRFGKQLIAFGGIIFLTGAVLTGGEAHAFGQQWRPAPGFGSAQVGSYGRIANTPSFRPHGAAQPTAYRSFNRPQRPYQQHAYLPRPYQPQSFAAQQYPMYRGGAGLAGGGVYPPQPRTAYHPSSGWPSPFAGMMQPWGPQMPMFTRQYAWRAAEQPWQVRKQVPRQRQPQYRVRTAPQTVGFRPLGPGFGPAVGSWRPAVQPAPLVRPHYAYQRYAARPPVNAAGRQGGFRTAPRQGYPMPSARIAGINPAPVQAGPGYWRPQAAAQAAAWHSGRSFRPQAYGRSVAHKAEEAAGKQGTGFTRDNLPGWVTTYGDSGYEGSCSWCSGS